MTPTQHTTTTTTTTELITLANQIAARQQAEAASDVAWCRRYPGLGSPKTYHRIRSGHLDGLDTDRWLADYRAVHATLEALAGGPTEEPLYDDLTPVVALRAALASAMRESANRRLILMVGEPGMGKTTAARLVAGRYGARVILTEADETWKDTPGAMLAGLLRACGLRDVPGSHSARLTLLVERLCATRTALIIDEAHHLGPRTLNLIKTLINRTPGEFIFLCLPTLWRRLETHAYDECRQLTRNRLFEQITLAEVTRADARRLLERRLPALNGACDAAAELARRDAARRGGLAWLAAIASQITTAGEDTLDLDTFQKHLTRTAALRGLTT